MSNIFSGVITALVTPIKDQKIDFDSLKKILDFQIASGIKTIVLSGSTGEGFGLSLDEKISLIKETKQISRGKLKIIAALGGFVMSDILKDADEFTKSGADGLMCSPPPYIVPKTNSILRYFGDIHKETSLPIMLYENPGRCSISIPSDIILKLASQERICALKYSGGNLRELLNINKEIKKYGLNFDILCGDDDQISSMLPHYASGCVSVVSNLLPVLIMRLCAALESEDAPSLALEQKIAKLSKILSSETNPVGIKHAMEVKGLCKAEMRLPLLLEDNDFDNKIKTAL